jgi:hypothetical protein
MRIRNTGSGCNKLPVLIAYRELFLCLPFYLWMNTLTRYCRIRKHYTTNGAVNFFAKHFYLFIFIFTWTNETDERLWKWWTPMAIIEKVLLLPVGRDGRNGGDGGCGRQAPLLLLGGVDSPQGRGRPTPSPWSREPTKMNVVFSLSAFCTKYL